MRFMRMPPLGINVVLANAVNERFLTPAFAPFGPRSAPRVARDRGDSCLAIWAVPQETAREWRGSCRRRGFFLSIDSTCMHGKTTAPVSPQRDTRAYSD